MIKTKFLKCAFFTVSVLCSLGSFAQELLDIGKKTESDSISALILRPNNAISVSAGSTLTNGDFSNPVFENFLALELKRFLLPQVALSGNIKKFDIENYDFEDQGFLSGDFNVEWCMFPKDKFSPFIYAGAGLLFSNDFKDENYKIQGGIALEMLLTRVFAIVGKAEANYIYDEQKGSQLLQEADGLYYNASIGLRFYFGQSDYSKTKKRVSKKDESEIKTNTIEQQ